MEEDKPDIGIVISADDLTKQGIDSARANLAKFGNDASNASEQGSKAFKGVGFAAHELAHELGFTGPAARFLSHDIASMASEIGTAGIAFGVAGIAAIATYKIYEHFSDVAKQKSEALDKSIQSLKGEVDALYRNLDANEGVTKATYNNLVAKKALLVFDLHTQIEEETKSLEKQQQTLVKSTQEMINHTGWLRALKSGWFKTPEEYDAEYKQVLDRSNKEIEIFKTNLEKKQALLAQYEGKTPTYTEFTTKPEIEKEEAYWKAWRKADGEQWEQLSELQIKKQSEAWNQVSIMARAEFNLNENVNKAILENDKKLLAEKKAMNKMMGDMAIGLAGDMILLAVQSGKQGAEAQKRDAQYAIIVNTAAGVAKALATYNYPYNIYVGALVAAAGAVQYAKVSSASYGGGGGIGASSTGSLSGGGGQDNYRYFNYEQSQYGSGWRPGSGPSSGQTIIVNGDVYAQDGDAFQKKVSKAMVVSMQNNEYGVNKAVKRYANA